MKPRETRTYGRRAFLGVTAVGLSSLVWGRTAWDALVAVAPPGLISGWRIYTVAATMPQFDPASWRLNIDGLVGSPQTITYDELRALPSAEQVSSFHCVTGWTVQNVHWRGVRFADLLASAQPSPEASVLTFTSAEKPYVDTLSLQQAQLADVMLAYEMDGQPLPREHGAPVRAGVHPDPNSTLRIPCKYQGPPGHGPRAEVVTFLQFRLVADVQPHLVEYLIPFPRKNSGIGHHITIHPEPRHLTIVIDIHRHQGHSIPSGLDDARSRTSTATARSVPVPPGDLR